jgi:uncharacterized membrane protein (Fun14 family)
MTATETQTAASSLKASVKSYRWKPWKIAVISFAGLLVVAGGVATMVVGGGEPAPGVDAVGTGEGPAGGYPVARGYTGGTGPGSDAQSGVEWQVGEEPSSDGAVSPALLRGGISFFVAFRSFLRIGAIFVGIWALSIFILAYAGWVEVHWDKIDRHFIDWTHRLGDQFASFKTFITGSLPSTGLAGLGLFTGFKKK